MYALVRRFLKTAIGFLIVGLILGVWMIVERDLAGRFPSTYVVSAHTHAILVGFVMMMILGVALWLFPRPAKDDVRYAPRVAEVSYWLIALGTAVRIAGELLLPRVDAFWVRIATVAAATMQAVGIALFFHTMWSRIRPAGSQSREARGEKF